MPRSRIYKSEGIIVKQIPLGESDIIFTIITSKGLKIRAVAKGVRKPKSKLSGTIDLLNLVSVSVARGRNLDILSEAYALETFRTIKEDLASTSRALYIAELTDIFTVEGAPSENLYSLFFNTLKVLDSGNSNKMWIRNFELKLLEISGFMIDFFSCIHCRKPLNPHDHLFSHGGGGVLCPSCRIHSPDQLNKLPFNTLKVLRYLIREGAKKSCDLSLTNETRDDLERVLTEHMKFLAEKEIKTLKFMSII